jgi:MFS family permease
MRILRYYQIDNLFCLFRFGRKPILFVGILIIIVATIIQSASVNLPMLIVSRLIVGFGGMFVTQPSPMLIAELAYPTHRGKYTCAFWTMYYLGMEYTWHLEILRQE